MITSRATVIVLLVLAFCRGTSVAETRVTKGDSQVVLGDGAHHAEKRAAELLAACVKERSGFDIPIGDGTSSKYALVVGTAQSNDLIGKMIGEIKGRLKPDGFHLVTTPDAEGRVFIAGQSPSGVVAGVGRFLRMCRYADGAVTVPCGRCTDYPRLAVRGMYVATHLYNFYHAAPLEEVDKIIEELALWGASELMVVFNPFYFSGMDDPDAQEYLARLKHFSETARGIGMKFGVVPGSAHQVFKSSPKRLRSKAPKGHWIFGPEVCPSKPEGLAYIAKCQREILGSFPQVDSLWCWPYDSGGCGCEECAPWGANGFLRAGEQLAGIFKERFPKGKVWLATWWFDTKGTTGEFDGLLKYMNEEKPDWFDGIMTGAGSHRLQKPLTKRPNPQRYPLTCFPEISMHKMKPWGGCGANPLPDYNTLFADEVRGKVAGGWPYSEGIYEDINKYFWIRFYWNPDQETDDILAEYASYYFDREVAEEAVRLFHLLEKTLPRENWSFRNLTEADEAWELAESIDRKLPSWAGKSWRWRFVHIRARIDHAVKNHDLLSSELRNIIEPLGKELERINYAKRAGFGKPAPLPEKPADNLAFGRPVTVSSTGAKWPGSQRYLVDGDPATFWVNNPARERTSWVVIDLGERTAIGEVKLQFRQINGEFWFVPESVAFEVSDDGTTFRRALVKVPETPKPAEESRNLPEEGARYTRAPWAYELSDAQGRFIRVNLGSSQRRGNVPFANTTELTEVEVRSAD